MILKLGTYMNKNIIKELIKINENSVFYAEIDDSLFLVDSLSLVEMRDNITSRLSTIFIYSSYGDLITKISDDK